MDTIRRVEELSYAKGISLAQLARMSGVSNSTLKTREAETTSLVLIPSNGCVSASVSR